MTLTIYNTNLFYTTRATAESCIAEKKVILLFLQLLRRIRLRSLEGLPEDGEEGNQQGDDGSDGDLVIDPTSFGR